MTHAERHGHESVKRSGRRDCLICHREREKRRKREAGAAPRGDVGYHVAKYGHEYEARKGNGCKVCHRMRASRVRNANPERDRARSREYHRKNQRQCAKREREWREKNREHLRAYFRKRERGLPSEHKRALKRAAYHKRLEHYRTYNRTAQMRRHGGKGVAAYAEMVRLDPCSYCGAAGGQADHIIPLARGGKHEVDNLTGACLVCNSSKNDTPLLVFLATRRAA